MLTNVVSLDGTARLKHRYPGLRFTACQHHRNGSWGAGYFAVRMEFRVGREKCFATAIVFEAAEHIAILADEPGRGVATSYRYEDFETELRAFVASPAAQAMCWPGMAVQS